ncbi:MAG: SHOCT domain-containing protein [Solirubrobacterales bacterium]
MIDEEIEALVAKLDRGEITEEEFQRRMKELVQSATTEAQTSTEHSVMREQIQAASKRAKQL